MPGRGATTEEYEEYMNLIRENNNRAAEIRRLKKELAVKGRALELACDFENKNRFSSDYPCPPEDFECVRVGSCTPCFIRYFTKQAEKEINDEKT